MKPCDLNKFHRSWLTVAVAQALSMAPAPAATITVNNAGDSGVGCTLREAIISANEDSSANAPGCVAGYGGDIVVFSPALSGLTITLGGTQVDVTSDIDIVGPGPGSLALSGGGQSRILSIVDSDVTIDGLTFTGGNESSDHAGAIRISNSGGSDHSVVISNSTITGNTATRGGGIYMFVGTLTVDSTVITGNAASTDYGGGLDARYASLNLYDSTVSANTATRGGGMDLYSVDLNMINSTVAGNTATDSAGGGIRFRTTGESLISRSTISGNHAYLQGGGLYLYSVNLLTMENSTISGNSSMYATGGVFMSKSVAGIYNVTVTGNSGGSSSGFSLSDGTGVVMENSILANNSGGDCRASASILFNNGGNIVESNDIPGYACVGFPASGPDPLLAPLRSNGGATLTHALLPGSPAIDGGDNEGCLPTDQRGQPRSDGGCDSGAYEFVPEQCFTAKTTQGTTVVFCL